MLSSAAANSATAPATSTRRSGGGVRCHGAGCSWLPSVPPASWSGRSVLTAVLIAPDGSAPEGRCPPSAGGGGRLAPARGGYHSVRGVSGQGPAHRSTAELGEQLVGPGEGPGAEEPAGGGQR